jgi:hypothetical protein
MSALDNSGDALAVGVEALPLLGGKGSDVAPG